MRYRKQNNNTLFYLLAAILILIVIIPTGISPNSQIYDSTDFSIFNNQEMTQPLTQIHWNPMEPNQNTTYTIYIQNNINQTLSISYSTIQPPNFLTLTWNQPNPFNLAPYLNKTVTFTLSNNATLQNIGDYKLNLKIQSVTLDQ